MNIKIVRKESSSTRSIRFHEGDVPYLTFPALDSQDWLVNGFSTRMGGVSTGPAASMNLGFAREGSKENVRENYRIIAGAIGFDPTGLVMSKQTHTTNVKIVTESDRGTGYTRDRDYDDVDGLITDVPGIVLSTVYADCVPLIIADPVHKAVGTSHSGWRGTVGDIAGETLRKMKEAYGTEPSDCIAVIGPSICQDCYEVSEEVIEQFRNAYDPSVYDLLFYKKENGHYQLNLWEACRQNFLRAGVRSENISLPDLCTCCNSDWLFSHRGAVDGKHGLLAAFVGIRE